MSDFRSGGYSGVPGVGWIGERDSLYKDCTEMNDRRLLVEGEYEFGVENGVYVVVHKHKVKDDHYPYTMVTVRYYHHARRTCLECNEPLPEHLLMLRDLAQK